MYVVLEGIDTSGKSTQIQSLKQKFPNAIFTKEPGGTQVGLELREIALHRQISPLCRTFLFLADRAEHFERIILPHNDKLIISDRSLFSGIAYADNIDEELLLKMNQYAIHCHIPHLVILLELDKAELRQRLSQKIPDRIEECGVEKLLYIQARIKKFIKKLNCPCVCISSSESKERITELITKKIKELT
ncbi:dTMP kinase [Helicobacter monodelphidis]|uniref:dTMP kinase n=1 Tax=Helicobacter sp. 15-1451 TaxID=2004995 RepID=UPI000DCE0324|nr:dTMP kinase [Helicobacter sp. 15-1451]RAX58657.1 dTMP kinase [Helicobacter sp. 15-1451]